MRILVLIALLITIPALCINNSILQNAPENLLDRNKKAAPASGIEQILDRHLPLGRVFNALYLEMELDDKKIDGLDIVASMYNLKDRKSLEKLVSLKVDGLAEQLKTLDKAVKSVPEGIGQIADVDSIIEKYKMVQGINQTVRETMLKATIVEKVPVLKKPTASLDSFTNLKENLARKALTLLKDLKTTQDTITFDEFSNSIDDIKRFSMLPFLLKELEVLSENPLDHLVTGVRTAIEIQDKTVLFEELKKHLFETRTELTKLQPLISENLTFGRVEEILKTIGTVFKPYAELVKTISISAAFMSNHDLSSFKDDVSNNWIKSVLNEGRDLKDILSSLNEFKKTANTFNQHRNLLRTAWRAGISSSISRGVEFVSGLNNHTSLLHEFRIDLFLNCLNVSTAENKPQIEELVDLSKSLITLKLSVSSLKMITTKVDFSVIATKLDRLWQNLEDSSDDGSSSDWLDGREYHDIEKLLQELASTLDEMKQSDTLIEFVQSIETEGVKIKKAQEWIAGFQFIHPECDFMFKLDFNRLRDFNTVLKNLTRIKSGPHIERVQEMAEALPSFQMGLKTLSSSAVSSNSKTSENSKSKSDDPKSKRAKRSASEIDVNRQSLLEFAFATRSLELIKKIGHMKMDFETVYREGAHVVGMISNITNLEKRKMMEDAWKDFTVIKKDLETFRIKNIRSVNAIWGPPEKTLVDIGRVYKSILVFTFFKQEEVRKMRDSLRYLDIPNIELEKALDNLEELLFMDWGLVYTNFQKISSILPGLQKEFSEFFAPPDDDKEDDFGMKIIMYIGIVFGTLIVLALVVFSVVMCVLVSDPDEKLPPPKEPVYTVLQVHQLEHTYMQLQDARLDINKIDKNGDTPIYQAIRKGDFAAVEDLLNKGAILDASCNGAQCRTALFELVLKKKETLISKFLKAGANPNISNANGDSVVKFAGKYGMSELFQNRYERKQYELPRILPKVPRYWKVLVMNHRCVKLLYKRFLPRRIKNHITWGYKEGMDLDSFSHIVVPDNLLYDDVTLKLDDENLLAFRLLGCWANLMSVEWFKALADKKIHENAMNSDCRYFLRNVEYRGTLNYDTILKQKNSIHQLRPGLLTNTVITILPTKNDRRNKQREEIQKLIEQFGGEYSTEVILAGQEMREMPYYAVDIDNLAVQNRIWILKYSDSDYGSKWQESPMLVTLSDIQLLFECIARWELLHFENDIVKAVYNKRALRR